MKNVRSHLITKLLVIFIVLLVSLFLLSCNNDSTDIDPGIKSSKTAGSNEKPDIFETFGNNVARIEEIVGANGKVEGKKYFDKEDLILYEEHYDYLGRTIEYTKYNNTGSVSIHTELVYLSGNIPDHYETTEYAYKKGTLSDYTVTKYDKNDLPQKISVYSADGNMTEACTYEYDKNGNLKKEIHINDKNYINFSIEYEYDEYGKRIKETYLNGKGEITTYTEFTYNKNNTVKKEINYDAKGVMTSYADYQYDTEGNYTGKKEFMPDENGDFTAIN